MGSTDIAGVERRPAVMQHVLKRLDAFVRNFENFDAPASLF
jgi:hypothetical protein